MGNDLPNEEEAVDQVKLLPQGDFLQAERKLMVRYIKKISNKWKLPGILKTCLVPHDFNNHLFEEVRRATRPPVLLIPISFEGTRQFILHLKQLIYIYHCLTTEKASKVNPIPHFYNHME